jgi:putative endonuclease
MLQQGRGYWVRRRRIGARGEEIAANYLKRRGYLIRGRNIRLVEGEIDIVAEKGELLVFVEVRTRTGSSFGTPEESVTARKREKLLTLAQAYIQAHEDLPPSCRIDVVAVELTPQGRVSRIEHIENVTD